MIVKIWSYGAPMSERTIGGKIGQAFLQELIQALDSLPDKKLVKGTLKKKW